MSTSEPAGEQTVVELGEGGILEAILPILHTVDPILGPGDDAAALEVSGGQVLVSIDTIVENQDFRRKWPSGVEHRAFDIGWKSAAQNLSDINAMGGRATGVLTSLSLPADTTLAWVQDLARGFARALGELTRTPPAVLGGDLGLAGELSVTTTVLGQSSTPKVLRSGARAGHVLAIAGNVGVAAAGLALLDARQPATSWDAALQALVQGQLRPVPPLESGPRAAAAGASAMMDLSDGLIVDAHRLARASGVQLRIDSSTLAGFARRLDPAAALLQVRALDWVLYGGEDFGLLATFEDPGSVPREFTIIGTVAEPGPTGAGVHLDEEPASACRGFDHFA